MEFITDFDMITLSIMVAVVIGVSEGIKKTGILNIKYIPLCNIVLGVVLCIVFTNSLLQLRFFNGILAGLIASGLFSTQKNVREGMEGDE